jgi:hypothetical protein
VAVAGQRQQWQHGNGVGKGDRQQQHSGGKRAAERWQQCSRIRAVLKKAAWWQWRHCIGGGIRKCKTSGGIAVANGLCMWWQHVGSGGRAAAARQQWRVDSEQRIGGVSNARSMAAAQRQRCGSRAVFVGALQQLIGSNERGVRAAGHWRQQLQQSGRGSGSMAMAASAGGQQWQRRGSSRVAAAAQWQYSGVSGRSCCLSKVIVLALEVLGHPLIP